MVNLAGDTRKLMGTAWTYIEEFPDAGSFARSGWSEAAEAEAGRFREGFENAEARRVLDERAAGKDVGQSQFCGRLNSISDDTLVSVFVGDEPISRVALPLGELSDSEILELFHGEGPLHVECSTSVYDDGKGE